MEDPDIDEWVHVDWIHLAQDRGLVACSSEHGNEPSQNDENFLTRKAIISFRFVDLVS